MQILNKIRLMMAKFLSIFWTIYSYKIPIVNDFKSKTHKRMHIYRKQHTTKNLLPWSQFQETCQGEQEVVFVLLHLAVNHKEQNQIVL